MHYFRAVRRFLKPLLVLTFVSDGFAATAVFSTTDTTTIGNWKGTYGADGSNIIGGTASYPSYATVTPSGNSTYVWSSSTNDARALQTASGSNRIAGTWYAATSFTIDINLTDAQPHTVAIYFLDWEVSGRAVMVTVKDASTSGTLDTRNLSNFGGGAYLVWTVTGHVTITIAKTGGANAVASGLFFSPPPITGTPTATVSFVKTDSSTQGKWKTVYGAEGYDVINDSQSLPSYLSAVTPTGNNSFTWTASTNDVRALQKGTGSGQLAACWFASGAFTIDLNLTGGATHNIAAYFVDWEGSGRSEKIELLDTGTGIILDTRTLGSFGGGQYLVWTISGHVTMRISALAGDNSVISGLFFDTQITTPPSSTATFVTTDTSTQGNWSVPYGTGNGPYGTDGYLIPLDSTHYPSYVTPTVSGGTPYTWISSTGDGRSLITGSGTSRIASTWFASSGFSFDLNLTDSNVHTVALYCMDWDNGARAEKIQVTDYATGAVLDTRTISTFTGGVYLVWNIKGHVTVTVTLMGGANAVVSGIFFGSGTLIKPASNPTQTENNLTGTSSWQLTNPAIAHEIEGYALLASVTANNQISFFVSTTDPSYTLQVYRMGWYNGAGARQVLGPVNLAGIHQATPAPDPVTGLLECNWTSPYVLTVPSAASWPSGVYLAKLTGSSGKQSYIIFVVRDDARSSKYLFQTAVATYQAYNNWGGKSLYGFNSTNSAPAYKVSFNRPYALGAQNSSKWGIGAGHFLTTAQPVEYTPPAGLEYNMVRFLEREGYDVTYSTDIDAHENASLLLNHKGILVVGHSEYWSWQMRSSFEAARDSAVNLGFFGANTSYWQIRFEPSTLNGAADRNIVGYKEAALTLDPYALDSNSSNDQYITTYWRRNSVKPPEDAFVGVMYLVDPVASDIIIKNASNPIFALTGVNNGNALPGLLGYEVDEAFGDAPSNQVILSNTPVGYTIWAPPAQGAASNMSIYTAPSGATVFATGTIWWSWGLDEDYFSPAIRTSRLNAIAQQITRNVLLRFVQ